MSSVLLPLESPDTGHSPITTAAAAAQGRTSEISDFSGEEHVASFTVNHPTTRTPLLGGSNRTSRSDSCARGSFDHSHHGKQKLGVLAVSFLAFFNVSGGPIGSEEIVSSVGPLPGFIGMFIFAFGWGLPLSLITSELSTAFPDDGGYSIWVAEAYGVFWGFQESIWSWFSGVVDSAVYPLLAYETVVQLIKGTDAMHVLPPITEYVVKIGIMTLFSIPNFIFLSKFGQGLSLLVVFVMVPFVVMAICSLMMNPIKWDRLLEYDASEPISGGWFDLASVLYWNFSGFDCCSTFAGEVKCPSKTYPRGTILALLMTLATYILVLGAAVLVGRPNWTTWEEGSLPSIAETQVGHWMAVWVLVASIASNLGMFAAEVFEDSWQLYGMAEAGLAPKVFKFRHKSYDTPWTALIAGNVLVAFLMSFDFTFIIGVSNFFSVISAILELCAFLKLRTTKPNLSRPYKVPVESTPALLLVLAFPMGIGMFVAITTLFQSLASFVLCSTSVCLGVGLYNVMHSSGQVHYKYNGYGSTLNSQVDTNE